MRLTEEQLEFLEEQGISLGSVFDAGGVLRRREYRSEMEALGKVVAIGVTPCAREKHQLRTRSGACAMCNPDALRFQERWSQDALVYIAGSQSAQILKVGFASNVSSRIGSLNSLGYAGINDWEALYWAETENAGLKEYRAHLRLRDYACPRKYTKAGRDVNCLETFACDVLNAIRTVREVAKPIFEEWINEGEIQRYQFKATSGGRFIRKKGDKALARATPIVRLNSRGSGKLRQATVKNIPNAGRTPAAPQATPNPQVVTPAASLRGEPTKPQFHGFTARCPACGRLNRINANRAHLKPICGSRECKASLVGLPTR